MKALQFIRSVAENYFLEKESVWARGQIIWKLTFIAFFSLYLLQIYGNYIDSVAFYNLSIIDSEEFWKLRNNALKIEAIVLFGVFVRFVSSLFREKWAFRLGEVGTLLAFSAFCRHVVWSNEIQQHINSCSSPLLIGLTPIVSQLIGMFFFSWFIYKIVFLIAVTWKTVRK